jgi:cell division protease FtsH
MSEKVGYLSFADTSNQFLYGMSIDKKYGEETARLIDSEVKVIIDEAHQETRRMLNENRDKLERMATDLLRREVLNYKDLEEILGKRPNMDDLNTNVDFGDEEKPAEPQAELPKEERAALEAAVEKLKARKSE